MDLQSFNNQRFGKIRVAIVENQPWLVAVDICRVLGLSNVTVTLSSLANDEKAKLNLGFRGGETNVVNEAGFYNMVLCSRKREAKEFTRWITHDILPTIRKTGGYVADEKVFLETYFPSLDEQSKQFFAMTLQQVRQLNSKIEADKPKVELAEAVTCSANSILVGELAKILKQNGMDIGQNRLFALLRKDGFLIKDEDRSDYNMPTQYTMNRGLMEVKESFYRRNDGQVITRLTPAVTGKGQEYFVKRYIQARA